MSGSEAAAYKRLPVAQLVAASDGARKCSLALPFWALYNTQYMKITNFGLHQILLLTVLAKLLIKSKQLSK